ncbi:TRAP transporter small permease [Variovorax sp.]|uniref:TRAP transporter small permease subunit n=1 Tax=Variovorax sp. TaxID=1871043 RepID=UPI002D30A9B6|nr:TRAP transporter small permease [Variovorax sp.]HYP84985.1 TRAP transporter small permease [Variovorax sp.]
MSSNAVDAAAAASLPGWARAINAVSQLFGAFSAGLIVVSIAVVCQMVFVRAVLGESSIWQTEFVIFALVAATFLGAPYIMLTRGHVAVDVVPLMMGDRARRRLYAVGHLVALAFCLLFFYASISWWWEVFEKGQTTSSIWRARLWIPYLSVPVGLGLLSLQMFTHIVLVLGGRELPFGLAPDARL